MIVSWAMAADIGKKSIRATSIDSVDFFTDTEIINKNNKEPSVKKPFSKTKLILNFKLDK